MNRKMNPMGRAIAEYFKTNKAAIEREQSDTCIGSAEREQVRPEVKASKLRVFSPMFEEDEIPLTTLFRSYKSMPEIERKALDMK